MPAGFNLGLVTAITSIAGTAGEILVNGGVVPVQGGGVVISIADGPSSISGEMYYLMTGISGALSTRLTASEVALIARDASISGGLEARIWATGAAAVAANLATIASTGQQAWTAANNNAINLSGRLTNTGAALVQRDIDISGGLEARIRATGAAAIAAVTVTIVNTGQQAWTAAQNNAVNLSGRLVETGATLFARDAAISGALGGRLSLSGAQLAANAAATYATLTNVTQTGATLFARDVAISGALAAQIAANSAGVGTLNGLSGTLNLIGIGGNLFIRTGEGQVFISGSGIAQSVDLIATGASLFSRDISISGGLEVRIAQSGQAVWTAAQNNAVNISGQLAATGDILIARDLSISGAIQDNIDGPVRISGVSTPIATNSPTGVLIIDFTNSPPLLTVTITGATIISGTNYIAGGGASIRLSATTGSNLVFPSSWRFLTSNAPSSIASGKLALLSLQSFAAVDSGVLCAYAVEP